MKNKFENPPLDVMKCSSKMHTTCLKLCNLPILAKSDKKENPLLPEECLTSKSIKLIELNIDPIVRTLCILTA